MRNFLTAGFEPGALPIRSMLPKFAEMGGLEPPCSFRHHAPFQGGPIPVMGHFQIVGPERIELPTAQGFNLPLYQLSYSPIKIEHLAGLEPAKGLPSRFAVCFLCHSDS